MDLDKKSLRAECLAAREKLPAELRAQAGEALAKRLIKIISEEALVIGAYRAIRGEIDLVPALQQLRARGQIVCLPVVVPGKPLLFRYWDPAGPLQKSRHGVEVPPADAPLLVPDAVLVPLVAFDAQGHRLGYGAGYYDRTIAWMRRHEKNVQMIGCAYSMQQVEHIPAESHDARLDAIVTEKATIRMKP